ncbi:hypothetical protein SAMN05444921_13529 [Streptomyces wuyuanensis]|uniref:Uncharacterized protein n=1 Tax=Streptomyces wuyuanensis TaxID=1196353 RepID=A0A1H0DPQ9_9ACTN|nr:hypothetical protein SAMN05444921_13529 [Streptomyces wuyuanensis]
MSEMWCSPRTPPPSTPAARRGRWPYLRNLAIGRLRLLGADNIAETTRAIRDTPEHALWIWGHHRQPTPTGNLKPPCTRQSCTKTRWAPTGGPPLRRSSCSARAPRTTTTSAYTQPRAPPVQSSSTAQKERAAPPTCGGRTTADRRPRQGVHAVRVRPLTSRHSTGDGARCPRTMHGCATRFRVPEWWCKTATAGPSRRFAGTGGSPISRCPANSSPATGLPPETGRPTGSSARALARRGDGRRPPVKAARMRTRTLG